jgi:hypothetical protein
MVFREEETPFYPEVDPAVYERQVNPGREGNDGKTA